MRKQKNLGAYYTDPSIAYFLVNWATRTTDDLILDPSFGEGVFFEAAFDIFGRTLDTGKRLFGIDIDDEIYHEVVEKYSNLIPKHNLILSDFFDVIGTRSQHTLVEADLPEFDAIVGNPPFIRYHRWKGKTRKKAQEKAKQSGVELNGLSSSWAPFVIYAVSFLKKNGRLAMVLPAEVLHASYAKPVVEFLWKSFHETKIIAFQRRIFKDISEDTVLILADEFSGGPGSIKLIDIQDAEALSPKIPNGIEVDIQLVSSGRSRLIEYLIPENVRLVYSRMKEHEDVIRLGDVAVTGIGYVTGNNEFFHLSRLQADKLNIPPNTLSPVVRKGSQLSGLVFTKHDWNVLYESDSPVSLLNLSKSLEPLPPPIQEYLEVGEKDGVHLGYKCRVRNPWWIVPHIRKCDAFVTYMSGKYARLVANQAHAFAPNTLHTLRMKEGVSIDILHLATGWMTSLTRLSTEIEGHSLGGGMLKLEPGEVSNVMVPIPSIDYSRLTHVSREIDTLLRDDKWGEASRIADDEVLMKGMGLDIEQVQLLQEGARILRHRRYNR